MTSGYDSGSSYTRWRRLTANKVKSEKMGSESYLIEYSMYSSRHSSGTGRSASIFIKDAGGASVTLQAIYGGTDAAASVERKVRRLNINKSAKTCSLSDNIYSTEDSEISLDSLDNTKEWYFGMYAVGAHSNSSVSLYSWNKLKTGEFSKVFDVDYEGDTIKDIIPVINMSLSEGNDASLFVSANGVDFEEVHDSKIHRFTRAGDNPKIKILTNSSIVQPNVLNHYAIWYNCGAA